MVTRRAVLAGGAGLAGLWGLGQVLGPEARLTRVVLENAGRRAREFEMRIAIDGKTRYDRTHRVEGEAQNGDGAGESFLVLDTAALPAERGRVELTVRVPELDAEQTAAFEQSTCYHVIAELTVNSAGADVGIFTNRGPDNCPE